MKFQDHFSQISLTYSKYRPAYPPGLFKYLAGCCNNHSLAWDCGTGNGQAAVELAKYFKLVIATDASREQINQALKKPNINYQIEPAEKISLANSSTDLVTVAVAVHWFDLDKFYEQVRRVLKPGGVIAVWTYHLLKISPVIDPIVEKYFNEILEGYWPQKFYYVKTKYSTLPFPFIESDPPEFKMITEWDLDQLNGFLNSWSGTKNYLESKGIHPVNLIWDELKNAWGDEKKKYIAYWPLHVRIGRV